MCKIQFVWQGAVSANGHRSFFGIIRRKTAFLRNNSEDIGITSEEMGIYSEVMQQRKVKYIYIFYYYRACVRTREKRFLKNFKRGKRIREKKKLRQKEKRKESLQRKTLCRLASFSWLHEKGQNPFPFCR